MTTREKESSSFARLRALARQWREEADRLEARGRRTAAERNRSHADELDGVLVREEAEPPHQIVKVPQVTHPTLCYKQPPLVQDDRHLNPMVHCTFPKGHEGLHSWEAK